ncbi:MAG TPA: LuxR C-terminal-related transcriptional regulator [Usitatibacter sp.]|nr:LuxR C-terminal-related transcriptional regulator [Usitatibacter sp.]
MANTNISERDLRMLELLSLGTSGKEIAKRLGYRPGTTRVYLHDLYRKLGVANRTAAAAWYFNHFKIPAPPVWPDSAAASEGPIEETVGDMAVRTDLLTALGAMSMLLGAYGKLWYVAARLKGTRIDAAVLQRRRMSRSLWEALLRGDFAHAKALYDSGRVTALLADAPSDALQAAVLLLLGGYSNADRVIEDLRRRRRSALSANEYELLPVLRDAVSSGKSESIAWLNGLASGSSADPARHIAMAALFHVYAAQGDLDRARQVANALWGEAEACHQHLLAMGERAFQRSSSLPPPPAKSAKPPAVRRVPAQSR